MRSDTISIIVPCYNEEDVIGQFYYEVKRVMNLIDISGYEILFVNDGSKDGTFKIIQKLSIKDKHVEYLSFSRNFGKESAMYAGLEYADGDYTVIMDADLQHPPQVIADMYEVVKSGEYDMVATQRNSRETDSKIRAFFGRVFYKIMDGIAGIEVKQDAMDFRMFNRKAKDAVLHISEYNRFSKGIFEWIGFRTCWLKIDIADRQAGRSKWSWKNLFLYSIEGCIAFSTIPLILSSVLGFLFCTAAVIIVVAMFVQACVFGTEGSGFVTIICVMLLIGGIQLFCMGILGQYLSKTYLESKRRPKYLIQDSSKIFWSRDERKRDDETE